jgi:hypothetical protein
MTTPRITTPVIYKHCLIAPAPRKSYDVFDQKGRWFNVKTQKQAKWWSSIHSRLENEFNSREPKPAPAATDNHTPKAKESKNVSHS